MQTGALDCARRLCAPECLDRPPSGCTTLQIICVLVPDMNPFQFGPRLGEQLSRFAKPLFQLVPSLPSVLSPLLARWNILLLIPLSQSLHPIDESSCKGRYKYDLVPSDVIVAAADLGGHELQIVVGS